MNKIKIFFGLASLVLAIGSAFATKAMVVTVPEYYAAAGTCYILPVVSNCGTTGNACTIAPYGQVFDVSTYNPLTEVYDCSVPLKRP